MQQGIELLHVSAKFASALARVQTVQNGRTKYVSKPATTAAGPPIPTNKVPLLLSFLAMPGLRFFLRVKQTKLP